MPAQETCVDADGFHEGILGAFDRILHFRRIGPATDTGSDLKGDGAGARKENNALRSFPLRLQWQES